jgi:DNA-binding NarL/FixJ family response regulator
MAAPVPIGLLTPREMDVVRLLGSGLRNREIGQTLSISEGTVKIHLHNIFNKLGLDSRLALGIYAKENRLS